MLQPHIPLRIPADIEDIGRLIGGELGFEHRSIIPVSPYGFNFQLNPGVGGLIFRLQLVHLFHYLNLELENLHRYILLGGRTGLPPCHCRRITPAACRQTCG
ncbi:hypothetical protein D3C81_1822780 [compost metagenome]